MVLSNDGENMSISPRLTVVMPVYNEINEIQEAIARVHQELSHINHLIIAVDDGSSDGTSELLDLLQSKQLIVIHNPQNQGKGYSLRNGISHINTPFGAYIDADLDLHPEGLNLGYEMLCNNPELGIVLGSKLHPDSNISYSKVRKLLSKIYRTFVGLLFDLHVNDTQTGLKIFRTDVVAPASNKTTSNGWIFDLELLALLHLENVKCEEIPVQLDYQFSSKVNLNSAAKSLMETIGFYFTFKRTKRDLKKANKFNH